jgi:hypothetical protein
MNFTQFHNETIGYTFYKKGTKQQVYKWELFWSGYTPSQAFKRFDAKEVIHPNYVSN